MRRYDKSRRRDREDLDARLDALQNSGPPRKHRKRRSNAGPTVLGILLVLVVLGAIYLIYAAATGGEQDAKRPVEGRGGQGRHAL